MSLAFAMAEKPRLNANLVTLTNARTTLSKWPAHPRARTWEGQRSYVRDTSSPDLWQDPQERYDIFMNNYTEHTWTLVTFNEDIKTLMKSYIKYPPRKAQSETYTGPITISAYQRFQWIRDKLEKEGFDIPLPSCVLMDQHMPSLNGLDVLRRMRSEGRRVPVIIVTGFDQPGLRQKCLDAGASDYLVKPLEASAVSTAIGVAIG